MSPWSSSRSARSSAMAAVTLPARASWDRIASGLGPVGNVSVGRWLTQETAQIDRPPGYA